MLSELSDLQLLVHYRSLAQLVDPWDIGRHKRSEAHINVLMIALWIRQ